MLEVVRRASSVSVEKLEERHPDVSNWDLHGKMKGWMGQILQIELQTTLDDERWSALRCSLAVLVPVFLYFVLLATSSLAVVPSLIHSRDTLW